MEAHPSFATLRDAAVQEAAGMIGLAPEVFATLAMTAGLYSDREPQAINDELKKQVKAIRNSLMWQAVAEVGVSDRSAFLQRLEDAFGPRWNQHLMGQMLFSFKKETARIGFKGFVSNADVKKAARKKRSKRRPRSRSAAPPAEGVQAQATPEAPLGGTPAVCDSGAGAWHSDTVRSLQPLKVRLPAGGGDSPESAAPAAHAPATASGPAPGAPSEGGAADAVALPKYRVKNTFIDDIDVYSLESSVGRHAMSCPGGIARRVRAASPDPSTAHYAISEKEASEVGKASSWGDTGRSQATWECHVAPPPGLSARYMRDRKNRCVALAALPEEEDPGYWHPPEREHAESTVEEVRHLDDLYSQHWRQLHDVVSHTEDAETAKRLLAPLVFLARQGDAQVTSAGAWEGIARWAGSDNHEARASTRARALLTGIVHGPVSLLDAAGSATFMAMVHRSKMDLNDLRPFDEQARREIAECLARTDLPSDKRAITAWAGLYGIVLCQAGKAVLADPEHWTSSILGQVVQDLQDTVSYWSRRDARVAYESVWALAEITQGLTAQEKDEFILVPQGNRIREHTATVLDYIGTRSEVLLFREAQRLLNESA